MGLFDEQGMNKAPATLNDMYRGVGTSINKGLLDPYMESKGFISEENQVLQIMKGVDLTDPKSVSDTFNKIMQISPAAAKEFQDQVMPILEANQAAEAAASTTAGVLQANLETAAYILNCDLKDPECRTKAAEWAKDYKRDNAYMHQSAINQADSLNDAIDLSVTATKDVARFDQMLDILPDIYTGFGSEAVVSKFARLADFFGVDATMAGKRELFASNAMDMALGYIAQTKGAISDTEFQAFQDATAGLKKTKVGNDLIIRTARRYAQWRINRAAEMSRWTNELTSRKETPTQAKWAAHEFEWANKPENRIKLPTTSEIKAGLEITDLERSEMTADSLQEIDDLLIQLQLEAEQGQ